MSADDELAAIFNELKAAKTTAQLLEAASLLSTVVKTLLDAPTHLLCGGRKHEAIALVALRSLTDTELLSTHADLMELRKRCDEELRSCVGCVRVQHRGKAAIAERLLQRGESVLRVYNLLMAINSNDFDRLVAALKAVPAEFAERELLAPSSHFRRF